MEGEKQTLSEQVDAMIAEADRRAFEIMHRIAALAAKTVVEYSGNDTVQGSQ